ncbi:MAG: DUF1735 domain-containing protein [Bacteroidales bacterium]|nr:DUF1735 domain-containing protein [Bacteroidales bacterium]
MKKFVLYYVQKFAVSAVLVGFGSCTFDDADVAYPELSVSFTYQDYIRNIVVGEGLKLNVGVTFAGVLDNQEERTVNYVVDPSLVTAAGKSVLPPAYYALGHPSQIVIPKGQLKGYLPVVLDSAAFLADPKSVTGEYILPIRLESVTDTSVSVNADKDFIRISLSYFGKHQAYYYYSGVVDRVMDGVTYASTPYAYIRTETDSRRFLETAGPARFRMVADDKNAADPAGTVRFMIDVPVDGSSVTIVPDLASPFEVRPDGTSTYNPDTRTFHLQYAWTLDDGTVCRAVEDLVFRNRIRDDQGNSIYINEWW